MRPSGIALASAGRIRSRSPSESAYSSNSPVRAGEELTIDYSGTGDHDFAFPD